MLTLLMQHSVNELVWDSINSAYIQHLIVAIVDCTHIISATASFKDLVTVYWRTAPTTGDALVTDQLQPPMDLVTVFLQQELHKLNSRTECGTFVPLIALLLF